MKKYWLGLLAIVMGLFISSCKNAGGSSDKDGDDEDKKEAVDFKDKLKELKSDVKKVKTADEFIDVLRDFYEAGIKHYESDLSMEEYEEMDDKISNLFDELQDKYNNLDKDELNKLEENIVAEEEMMKLAEKFATAQSECRMKMDSIKMSEYYDRVNEEPLDSMAVYDDYLYEEMDSVY